MSVTAAQRCSRLGPPHLNMPSVLPEDLGYHVPKTQLQGSPRAKEVGQEAPTTVSGPNEGLGGARLLAKGHIQPMAQYGHS